MEQASLSPSVKEIQKKLLGILLYFTQFCQAHGLRFTLAGGTCLGAARNQGFIPWDDDLDVFMLREDYEKLSKLWPQYADTEKYSLVRSNDKVNIHHAVTEIKDNHTTFINKHSVDLDINQGLMIDVIPLDNIAPQGIRRKLQMIYSMMYCCFNFQRLPEHKGKLTYYCTKLALGLVRSSRLRYRLWKLAEQKMIAYGETDTGLVASLTEGTTIMRQRFPRDWFENPAYLSFEGHSMPVPREYDQWLTVSYGNYMTPPPKQERVLRHDTVFIDLEHSYKQYKGIYYCKKSK